MSMTITFRNLRELLPSGDDEPDLLSSSAPGQGSVVAGSGPYAAEDSLEASVWDESTADLFLQHLRWVMDWSTDFASTRLDNPFESVYSWAEEQAQRGRDPEAVLRTLHETGSAIEIMGEYLQGTTNRHLVEDFVAHVGRQMADAMSLSLFRQYDIHEAARRLPAERREECLGILSEGLEKFARQRYRLDAARENRIRRLYDKQRTEGNIRDLLRKAEADARQGDIDGTVRWLSILEQKATGDWTPEIYATYAKAHEANFERSLNKGRRALSKGRLDQATRYLLDAEQHAIDAELPFRFADERTVAPHLPKQRQIEAYREAKGLYAARARLANRLDMIARSK